MCTNRNMLFQLPTELRAMVWERTWDDVAREEGRRAMWAPVLKELPKEDDIWECRMPTLYNPHTPGNADVIRTMEAMWAAVGGDASMRQSPGVWWETYDGRPETYPDRYTRAWTYLYLLRHSMEADKYERWQKMMYDVEHNTYNFTPEKIAEAWDIIDNSFK